MAAGTGDRVRGVGREIEAEVARLIAYMNDEVVPEVRRSSAVGLRAAAEQLGRMAQHLDRAAARSSARNSAQGSAQESARGTARETAQAWGRPAQEAAGAGPVAGAGWRPVSS